MELINICDLARTIRSKNAGAFIITIEIIFENWDTYLHVKKSGVITAKLISDLYGVSEDKIIDFVFYDPGLGIKANIRRLNTSGGPGETDVYGCQHYPPLMSIDIPYLKKDA